MWWCCECEAATAAAAAAAATNAFDNDDWVFWRLLPLLEFKLPELFKIDELDDDDDEDEDEEDVDDGVLLFTLFAVISKPFTTSFLIFLMIPSCGWIWIFCWLLLENVDAIKLFVVLISEPII
jgi:hypothetical protein